MTGDVRINSNRDRQTSYAIMALKAGAAKYSVAYTFSPKESTVVKGLVTSNCTEELREANDSRSGKPYVQEKNVVLLILGEKVSKSILTAHLKFDLSDGQMAKRKGVFLSEMMMITPKHYKG